MKRYIRSSTCDGYWYHARHGVGPGTIPRDVHLLKVIEDPENTWEDYFLLDRALTADELAEFDLREEHPPVYLQASAFAVAGPGYDYKMTYSCDGRQFAVRYNEPNRTGAMRAAIQMITPYDDAEYAWASIEGLKVTFYQGDKKLDDMHLWAYEEDEYEDIGEYVKSITDAVAKELINFNKDVDPVMVHN